MPIVPSTDREGGPLAVDGPLAAGWSAESLGRTSGVDGPSGEVTLIAVRVNNPAPVDRRVRVVHDLDGPVLPPRRQGVPERGWSDRGYERIVRAGERIAVGYASVAALEPPPVRVTDEGRARTADAPESTPGAVVRRLGTARPPADVVPSAPDASVTAVLSDDADPARDVDRIPARSGSRRTHEEMDESPGRDPPLESVGGHRVREIPAGTRSDGPACPDSSGGAAFPPDGRLPETVETRFAAVERRIERADRLAVASVPEAATIVSEAGGLSSVAELPERLAVDATALRRIAERARTLASRAENADVPVEALRRLS